MPKQLILFFFIFLIACGKEAIKSKPQLSIKNISNTVVPKNSNLRITLRLADKEGDFVDSLWVRKRTSLCEASNFIDSVKYRIPENLPRTKNFNAEILLTFDYVEDLQPKCRLNDTAVFTFWIKDRQGNMSDRVTTSLIVINR